MKSIVLYIHLHFAHIDINLCGIHLFTKTIYPRVISNSRRTEQKLGDGTKKLSKTHRGSMKRDRMKENRSGWIFINPTFCWFRTLQEHFQKIASIPRS